MARLVASHISPTPMAIVHGPVVVCCLLFVVGDW